MSVNALEARLGHAACPVTYPPDPSCLPLSHTHESTPLHTLPAGVSVDPPPPTVSLVLGLDSWSFWSQPFCVLHSQRHPQSSPGLLILHPGWLGCTFADDHRPGHTLMLAPASTIMDTGTQTHSTGSSSYHHGHRDPDPQYHLCSNHPPLCTRMEQGL